MELNFMLNNTVIVPIGPPYSLQSLNQFEHSRFRIYHSINACYYVIFGIAFGNIVWRCYELRNESTSFRLLIHFWNVLWLLHWSYDYPMDWIFIFSSHWNQHAMKSYLIVLSVCDASPFHFVCFILAMMSILMICRDFSYTVTSSQSITTNIRYAKQT